MYAHAGYDSVLKVLYRQNNNFFFVRFLLLEVLHKPQDEVIGVQPVKNPTFVVDIL